MRATLLIAALLVGCNAGPDDPGTVYAPEMFESIPYDAHDPNPVLPNGMTLQPPPEGTIPRGYTPVHYGPGPEEATAAAALTSTVEVSDEAIARGRASYDTFCAVCHGPQGDGDGSVVPPFPNPPSLKAAHAIDMPDGQLFHVITHGQGFMPSYAVQVPADDRWRIVMYVRQLQGVEPDPAARPADEPDDAAPTGEAAAEVEVEPVDGTADDEVAIDEATMEAAASGVAPDPATASARGDIAGDDIAGDRVDPEDAAPDADPSAAPPAVEDTPPSVQRVAPTAADASVPSASATGASDGD